MEARGTCSRRQRSETRCDSGGSLTDWTIDVPFDGEDLLATPDSHRQSSIRISRTTLRFLHVANLKRYLDHTSLLVEETAEGIWGEIGPDVSF